MRQLDAIRTLAGTLLIALLTALLAAPAAHAGFGVSAFDGQVSANTQGDAFTQAAGHPYEASTSIEFNRHVDLNGFLVPDANARDIQVDLPPGFLGNPTIGLRCTEPQLAERACPVASQVGVARVRVAELGLLTQPVFNMVPAAGSPGAFAFRISDQATIHLLARVRSDGDYGLSIDVPSIPHNVLTSQTTLTFWGIPADPRHDVQRGPQFFCREDSPDGSPSLCGGGDNPAGVPAEAFLTNPADCSAGPLTTSMRTRSWNDPSVWVSASFVSHLPPAYPDPIASWGAPQGVTGCDAVPFTPTLNAASTTRLADAPAGFDVDLSFANEGIDNPTGIASAPLRDAIVTLPQGMTISPSASVGLQGCSDAQLGLGSLTSAACPDASKIGTVEATTPLLEEPLSGSIYIRQPDSLDPESGEMFRIALVLENRARGITIKLPGSVRADSRTGQLQTSFRNNPQLPVERIGLHFKSGPRAPLATPPSCGPQQVNARLTSWSGHVVDRTDGFTIDCPGATGFAPSFAAGLLTPVAGSFSSFALRIARPDRQTFLDGLALSLPTGLTAQLKGVPVCAEADANAGTCPATTRVGTATVSSGPGSNPFYLDGGVFLTGPYKGAPIGLAVAIHALAGPFDLGMVVVRQAIAIDPTDAHITIVSDPLPTIVKGVPLRLRSLAVDVDRRDFMVGPTSCAQKYIRGTLHAADGSTSAVSADFAVANCGRLAYRPKMILKVGARGKLTRGKRTPLTVTLAMTPGQANNRSVQVTLPLAINARLDVVNKRRACSIEQFRADKCPMSVGTATAVTPLLRDPLRGPAYFVYNPARRLPDLVVRLRGQVDIDLVGKVTIARDLRLQTAFDTIPDVPVTKFTLALASGGRNGPVGVTRNLCSATTRRGLTADLAFVAQSGKRVSRSQAIAVAGCGKAKARARSRAGRK